MLDRVHDQDGPRVLGTHRYLVSELAPRDENGNTVIPEIDFRLRDAQGHSRWFLQRGTVIRNSEGKALKLIGTITDITGQIRMEEKVRRSHEQVRELARRLIAAQEHEQNRIARDLHDGLGAQLTEVVDGLAELESMLADEPQEIHRELTRLQTDMRGLGEAIRSLSHQMHPGAFERVELLPALRRLCSEFTRVQGLEVAFAFQGDHASTSQDITISLYRVTQEALRNIAKHSGAKKAEVSLVRRAGGIQLRIRDWGNGFHTPVGPPRGLGLLSIQERARLVGGQAYVLSAPGRGTEVRVTVPLPR
jgi:signal transduction histidine kinase